MPGNVRPQRAVAVVDSPMSLNGVSPPVIHRPARPTGGPYQLKFKPTTIRWRPRSPPGRCPCSSHRRPSLRERDHRTVGQQLRGVGVEFRALNVSTLRHRLRGDVRPEARRLVFESEKAMRTLWSTRPEGRRWRRGGGRVGGVGRRWRWRWWWRWRWRRWWRWWRRRRRWRRRIGHRHLKRANAGQVLRAPGVDAVSVKVGAFDEVATRIGGRPPHKHLCAGGILQVAGRRVRETDDQTAARKAERRLNRPSELEVAHSRVASRVGRRLCVMRHRYEWLRLLVTAIRGRTRHGDVELECRRR